MTNGSSWLRQVSAPTVPESVRRQLAEDPAGPRALRVLVFGLLGLVFGIAGIAVLATGAHPKVADPVVFQAVAGGGLLLVAVVALVACVRAAARRRAVRRARSRWGDQVITAGELAAAAVQTPGMETLLGTAFAAIDEVGESAPFRDGWLGSTFDATHLRETEWAIAVEARRVHRTGEDCTSLAGQVRQLLEIRSAVRRLAGEIEQRHTDDLLTRTLSTYRPDNETGVLAAIEEISHLVHRHDQE